MVPANFDYDNQTYAVMEKILKSNSNCIDVGAHAGMILSQMQKLSPQGIHYAFEPLPKLYENLRRNFPNAKIYGLALSDKNGKTTFQHVVNDPSYSGIRKRRYDKADPVIEEITVEQKKLDDIYPKNLKLSFMKVDVEGGEYGVFKGAVETIKRNKPIIVFEFGLGGADYYNITSDMIYELLVNECLLNINTMERWLSGQEAFTLKEFCEQFNNCYNYYFIAYSR